MTVAVRAWVVFLMGGEGEESGEAQAFMMGARPLERSLADLPTNMDAPPMSPATAAPPSDAAAGAGAGRSAPEILKGGLANLSENPFGWLFGKPSPLYSTEPSADRLQWEGDKAPAASPPSPPLPRPACPSTLRTRRRTPRPP